MRISFMGIYSRGWYPKRKGYGGDYTGFSFLLPHPSLGRLRVMVVDILQKPQVWSDMERFYRRINELFDRVLSDMEELVCICMEARRDFFKLNLGGGDIRLEANMKPHERILMNALKMMGLEADEEMVKEVIDSLNAVMEVIATGDYENAILEFQMFSDWEEASLMEPHAFAHDKRGFVF